MKKYQSIRLLYSRLNVEQPKDDPLGFVKLNKVEIDNLNAALMKNLGAWPHGNFEHHT